MKEKGLVVFFTGLEKFFPDLSTPGMGTVFNMDDGVEEQRGFGFGLCLCIQKKECHLKCAMLYTHTPSQNALKYSYGVGNGVPMA